MKSTSIAVTATKPAERVSRGAVRTAMIESVLPAGVDVLVVTGDGLKTPGLVAHKFEPTFVEPDADLILETLGVSV